MLRRHMHRPPAPKRVLLVPDIALQEGHPLEASGARLGGIPDKVSEVLPLVCAWARLAPCGRQPPYGCHTIALSDEDHLRLAWQGAKPCLLEGGADLVWIFGGCKGELELPLFLLCW